MKLVSLPIETVKKPKLKCIQVDLHAKFERSEECDMTIRFVFLSS